MNRVTIEISFMIFVAILAIIVVLLFVKNTLNQRRALNKLKVQKNKVLLFYTDWCEYSQQFMPVWESLLDKYQGIYSLEKYNIDTEISIAKQFDIKSVPVIYVVSDNKKKKYNGVKSLSNLSTFIESTFDDEINI